MDEEWIDVSQEKSGSVLKQIIKAAPTESAEDGYPEKGNKVKVHYVGTLTKNGSQFDSSLNRGKPFEFIVGTGVIDGWSQAIPTMLIGEKSKFRLAPSVAYGVDGQPPSIPSNAWLDFEIELLGFTDREDVSDGKEIVMKKTISQGEGWKKPSADCDIEIEIEHENTQIKGWWPCAQRTENLILDNLNIPVELRIGIEAMTMNEFANFRLGQTKCDYTFWNVRLISWIENEQCIIDVPGAVIKRTQVPSSTDDWQFPVDLDTVRVKGQVYVPGETNPRVDYGAIDSDDDQGGIEWIIDSGDDSIVIGDCIYPLCDGIDAALKKMKCHEVATVKISAEYGYKHAPTRKAQCGVDDHAAFVFQGSTPINQPLEAKLKLCEIKSGDESWNLKGQNKIHAVNKKRELGNLAFSKGDYTRAARRYDAAIQLGRSDYDIDDADKPNLHAAINAARCNRAACSLKLGDFSHACSFASDVLEQDPTNAKALFRRAKAYTALDEWSKAKADLRPLLSSDPNNSDAKRVLAETVKRQKPHNDEQKVIRWTENIFGTA